MNTNSNNDMPKRRTKKRPIMNNSNTNNNSKTTSNRNKRLKTKNSANERTIPIANTSISFGDALSSVAPNPFAGPSGSIFGQPAQSLPAPPVSSPLAPSVAAASSPLAPSVAAASSPLAAASRSALVASSLPLSLQQRLQPRQVDLTEKVIWVFEAKRKGFLIRHIDLFCRKVHVRLSKDPFPDNFNNVIEEVEKTMKFINQFDPFKSPNGHTLERQQVQGGVDYVDQKKFFEEREGRIWNDTAVSEGLLTSIGSGPGRMCINRPQGLVLTNKVSSDVLAHICQLAGPVPFESFLELLLIQRKSKFLWCFAKTILRKIGVGIFSASTLNPNNIRDDPRTIKAERYWETQLSYYIALCMRERSGLVFRQKPNDNMSILQETVALAAAGNATFRCLRYFSVVELEKGIKKNIVKSLVSPLHNQKDSDALSSMFVKEASIENIQLLSDSFFCTRSTQKYGTLMESMGNSIMDTLYALSKKDTSQKDSFVHFLFNLSSLPKNEERYYTTKIIYLFIEIKAGTREQLPLILMKGVGTNTRLLYAMFELSVYAGCDKIMFFIRTIKPQIGEMITSLAIAVNDSSHPISAYLQGTSGSNSEEEPTRGRGASTRGVSPIRNSDLSFRPVESGRGRSRVLRVMECDIRNQKTSLFIENILKLLRKATYNEYETAIDAYNFFVNLGAIPWTTRFSTLKEVKVLFLSNNIFPIFGDDEKALDKSKGICETIFGIDKTITQNQYEDFRKKILGLDPKTNVDAHYVPYDKSMFIGGFAQNLKQIGKALGMDVEAVFYPEPVKKGASAEP